jgi:CelD/BcsL family acetyltransferase involved in cellulose biosynthesis
VGTIRTLDIEEPKWFDFVVSRPEATPFHHPAWARLLADCYGFRCFALVEVDSNGLIIAGTPMIEIVRLRKRRWVSLPFTDSVDILRASDSRSLVPAIEHARRDAGIRSVVFRTAVDSMSGSVVGVIHQLPLEPDLDRLWNRFEKSRVRSEIRRAEREGVSVRVSDDLVDMRTFYELHLQTRQRQGVPIQPTRFFDLLQTGMIERGLGHLFIAEVEDRPAAAAVVLAWNGNVIFKLAASDRTLLRTKPNHALIWEAIRWSAKEGNATFDFGRSDEHNAGLRAFKSGWGAIERPLVYSASGGRTVANGSGLSHRTLGAVIRRSPPFVCKLVGETLYRYAA